MKVVDFRPNPDGFGFANHWSLDESEKAVLGAVAVGMVTAGSLALLWFPLAPFGLAIVAGVIAADIGNPNFHYGLCGGMAASALDYHLLDQVLSRGSTTQPERTSSPEASAVIWKSRRKRCSWMNIMWESPERRTDAGR